MKNLSLLLLSLVVLFVLDVSCQPDGPPDIDWGDYLHPPRTARKFRGGENTWIITEGNKMYGRAWYSMQDRRSVVFSVKACSSAYIALSDDLGTTDFTLQIGLGTENNMKSGIGYAFEPGYMFEQQTPQLLHCNEYRQFWMKWGYQIIDVGRGPIIGEQKFLNYLDRNVDYFVSVGFASGDGNSASWQLQENAGDYLEVHTPNAHRYTSLWKAAENRRFFSFSVRAAGHVHVLLSETLGNQETNIYEIVIGGWDNTKSGIRKFVRGDLLAETSTQEILSGTERRDFWVGWVNGTIEFGRGQLFGHHRVSHYNDPSPTQVRYLSLTTGFGEEGWWLFDDNLASTNVRLTPKANSTTALQKYNNTWIETTHMRWTSFAVKTESSASIVLSDATYLDPEFSYEVVLGYSGNSQSGLRMLFEPDWLISQSTSNIVNRLHLRHFWISWVNGTLRVGRGFIYGQAEMFSFQLPADFSITAYSFATPDDDGEWRFRDTFGDRIDITTMDSYSINQFWRLMPDDTILPFRVRACSDVHVLLTPTLGHEYTEMYYDIVISGWDNTKTQIRQVVGNNRVDESAPVDTTNLLNCAEFVNLYVSWQGNQVTIGQGEYDGHYIILQHSFMNWDPPRAVSLSSGFGRAAAWRIEEDVGDMITFYSNKTNANYDQVYMTANPLLNYKTFAVRSCWGVNVDLYSTTDGQNVLHYTVQLGVEGNTVSKILGGESGSVLAQESTPNILDCDHSRDFWVSWGDNKIEAGSGPVKGFNRLITTPGDIETVAFNVLGFDTVEDQYGRWIVKENAAMNAEFYTPVDFGFYYMWVSLQHKEYLTFLAYACSDVHVALTDRLSFDINEHLYEIVIGGWDNTRSVIKHNRVHRADVSTEGILTCDDEFLQEIFWITWHGGIIVVGKGPILGQGRFMDYAPVNPPTNIRSAAFSTGYGYDGRWVIPLLDGVVTPPVTQGPTSNPEDGTGGLSGGDIFGIVFGTIILVMIGVIAVLFVLNRRGHLQPPAFLSSQQDQSPIIPGGGFENPVAHVQEVDSADA